MYTYVCTEIYTHMYIHVCFTAYHTYHIDMYTYVHTCNMYTNVHTEIHTHIHRKSSLYLPLGSVNLVLKVMGTPDQISSPPGWNRVSPGCPRNFNTELTEPTRQIKTTFPMNMYIHVCFTAYHIYYREMYTYVHTCIYTYIHPHNFDTLRHNLTNIPRKQTITPLRIPHTIEIYTRMYIHVQRYEQIWKIYLYVYSYICNHAYQLTHIDTLTYTLTNMPRTQTVVLLLIIHI